MEEPTYKITQEDILSMVKFLRIHFSKLATTENAIKLLSKLHDNALSIEDLDGDELEKYLRDLEEH